jgi:hypothetical protein
LLGLVLLGCSETNFSQLTKVDVFQQNRRNTVDMLLVVDNSCSMIEEQKKLASNFDSFITYFDGADVDWQLGVVTTDMEQEKFQGHLIGGDDEIVLANAAGTVIDQLAYDHDWAITEGESYQLDPSWYDGVHNDSMEHWCSSPASSAGVDNGNCPIATLGDGPDPAYGEVIVTEFMADPAEVDDTLGEWVELRNLTDADIDLGGWTLSDAGKNSFEFPDGTTISADGTLVVGRNADPALNGGIGVDVAVEDAFTLNNDVLLLSDETVGPGEIFEEMVAQGTSGSGLEMGLEAARAALTDPDLAEANAGLVREEANLSILIVSDEQDSSPDPVDAYLRDFADIKGDAAYRDHTVMNVSAVVGDQPPEFDGEPSCSSENGEAEYGSRYVDAVAKTGGLIDSICDEDFSPIVSQLGLTLSGLLAEFQLSAYPDLDTLKVGLYETNDESSKIRDLVLDVDFAYVEERNSIRFEYEQVPESEQYVQVEYKVRSGQ